MALVPFSEARHSVARVRWLYLRALGLVFVLAFASLMPQLSALLGPQGLSPASALLDYARQVLPGPERSLRLPTLLWWTRKELGPYCPSLTLENGRLRAVP